MSNKAVDMLCLILRCSVGDVVTGTHGDLARWVHEYVSENDITLPEWLCVDDLLKHIELATGDRFDDQAVYEPSLMYCVSSDLGDYRIIRRLAIPTAQGCLVRAKSGMYREYGDTCFATLEEAVAAVSRNIDVQLARLQLRFEHAMRDASTISRLIERAQRVKDEIAKGIITYEEEE